MESPPVTGRARSPMSLAWLFRRIGPVVALLAALVALKWPWGYDLDAYLTAARAVAAGGSPYAATLATGIDQWGIGKVFVSPPFVAHVLAPFSSLPEPVILAGWTVASLAMIVVALRLIDRDSLAAQAPFVVFSFVYVWGSLVLGQVNALAMAGVLMALGSRRPGVAGFGLALAIATRALPGAFAIVLILERRWRALAWTAGLLVLAFLVRPQDWISYLDVARAASGLPTLTLASVQTSLAPWPPLQLLAAAAATVVLAGAVVDRRDPVLVAGTAIGLSLVLLPTNAWHHWLAFGLVPLMLRGDDQAWSRRAVLAFVAVSFIDYGVLSSAVALLVVLYLAILSVGRIRSAVSLRRSGAAAILRQP